MDLTYQNLSDAGSSISTIARNILGAQARTKDVFEIMQAVATSPNLKHVWEVTVANGDLFQAAVGGKPFKVVARPAVHDSKGKVICYVVVTDPVSNEAGEVARFLVTSSGEIQYANGEMMHSASGDEAAALLLANITALVLAPRPE